MGVTGLGGDAGRRREEEGLVTGDWVDDNRPKRIRRRFTAAASDTVGR